MHTAPADATAESVSSAGSGSQPETPRRNDPRRAPVRIWIALIVIAVVLAGILLIAIRSRERSANSSRPFLLATPSLTLRMKGTTEAVQARGILAPQLAGQQVATLTIIH